MSKEYQWKKQAISRYEEKLQKEGYTKIQIRAKKELKAKFEKFVADEKRETTSADPNKQNLAAVRDLADIVLKNDGTEAELFAQVEAALAKARS